MENPKVPLITCSPSRVQLLTDELKAHGLAYDSVELSDEASGAIEGITLYVERRALHHALELIESGRGKPLYDVERRLDDIGMNLLIPVDFSPMSLLACRAGFELARRLDLQPVLLHAYISGPMSESLIPSLDDVDSVSFDDIETEETTIRFRHESELAMRRFKKRLTELFSRNEIPFSKFTTMVREGVPEDVIANVCREISPQVVVMAPRGRHTRERDMIGSVTAEVIDNCRVPVFTVPQNYSFPGIENIRRLAVFCNLDRNDVQTIDQLMRMFDYPEIEVWLIPVREKLQRPQLESRTEVLRSYFVSNYPTASFHSLPVEAVTLREKCEDLISLERIQMIIVPNKRKNIFSRLFNPGIAHRILFERDIPMLAMPV